LGTCPGKQESAEQNDSNRSAKGNKYLRRVLNQAAHAAAAKKGSLFPVVFRCLLPQLGCKSAIWAVAHRLSRLVWKILHEGPGLSSKLPKLTLEPRSNGRRCWHELFASSDTGSP
jgi:Transposase IS116/IS110/IS902 family